MPVEVKALSRLLCYRLKDIIPHIIHPIQTGFVSGRRIHDHIIFMRDLQDKCTLDDEETFAMFLDFEKAYDRVNWNYMYDVLETMNFGERFIAWIQLLYCKPIVYLLLNGSLDLQYTRRGVSNKGVLYPAFCSSSQLNP